MSPTLRLRLLEGELAVCRLEAAAPAPDWSHAPGPLRVEARTEHELSIVCAAGAVPADVRAQGPFRALRVRGTLAFGLVGILADLSAALAEAGISIFAVSTYDTDYLLVPSGEVGAAVAALRRAGHDAA